MIYSQLGYDPSHRHQDSFKHWHERLALNYQSAPRGYFHVFNEAHTIIYEMIHAGAKIGPNLVVDISIGQHWGSTGRTTPRTVCMAHAAVTPTGIQTHIRRPRRTFRIRGVILWGARSIPVVVAGHLY